MKGKNIGFLERTRLRCVVHKCNVFIQYDMCQLFRIYICFIVNPLLLCAHIGTRDNTDCLNDDLF